MQKHVKVYLEYHGIDDPNTIICQICSERAVDIHHIVPRSKFGKKTKHLQDSISNIIPLCRVHHQMAHFQIEPYLSKEELKESLGIPKQA